MVSISEVSSVEALSTRGRKPAAQHDTVVGGGTSTCIAAKRNPGHLCPGLPVREFLNQSYTSSGDSDFICPFGVYVFVAMAGLAASAGATSSPEARSDVLAKIIEMMMPAS